MLQYPLIHPQLLAALGAAGHGSKVLIADGNYPHGTARGRNSVLIHLNLRPGLCTVSDVLEPVVSAVPIEAAAVMTAPDRRQLPVHEEFRNCLGVDVEWQTLERFAFYQEARSDDVAVVVATGDQRIYANLLLTIGVRMRG